MGLLCWEEVRIPKSEREIWDRDAGRVWRTTVL